MTRRLFFLRTARLFITITELLALCSIPAMAATITVCPYGCNCTTIEEGIFNAVDGDIIEIYSGEYNETVIVNRSLTLTGVDTGTGYPVINASGAEYGVTLESPDSTLHRLNITGANSSAILLLGDGAQLQELTVVHPKDESRILTYPAVTGENVSGIMISSCTFDVLKDTVVLYDPHDYSIINNTFLNPLAYSIAVVSSGSENPTTNGTISGNFITQERGAGIGIVARTAAGLVEDLTIADNTIAGSGGSIGLFIPSRGVTIRNNTLQENPGTYGKGIYGIMTYGTSGVVIADNHVHDTDMELAYRFESCSDLNVMGNTVASNTDTGMGFLGVTNSTVSGNTMSGNVYNFWMSPDLLDPGVFPGNQIDQTNLVDGKPVWYFEGVDDLSVDGSDDVGTLLLYACNNATVRDLSFTANSDGVMAVRSENVTITNCSFQQLYQGIMTVASPHLTIRDNHFTDCFDGLMVGDLYDGLVSGNTIENSGDCGILTGIYLEDATVSDNVIDGAVAGMYLDRVSGFNNAVFSGNTIRNTLIAGISTDHSEGAVISGNYLEPERGVGFDIRHSSSLTITGNTLSGAAGVAFLLYDSPENSIASNILTSTGNGFIMQRQENVAGSLDNVIDNNFVKSPEPVLFCLRKNVGDETDPSKFGTGPMTPLPELPSMALISEDDPGIPEDFTCDPDPSPPANTWNTTKTAGTNIAGGPYLGGNYWATPAGTGFSQTHPDRGDGFCNARYALDANNSDELPLHLRTKPAFYADFTATPLSGPAPLFVAFTDASDGSPDYWSYNFGDGKTSSSRNPVHTYQVPGTYTVSLTILKVERGQMMRTTTVKQGLITVGGGPGPGLAANFTAAPLSGPAPLPVTFTDTSTGSPQFWNYNFGDGSSSTAKSPVHTYRTPGTYTVTLTVMTFERGMVRNTTVKQDLITVGGAPGPGLAANFTAAPLSGTAPLPVSFTDTSTGSPDYWSYNFGDGTSSSDRNAVHTYRVPGNYTVALTVMKVERGGMVRNTTVRQDLVTVQ